MEWQGPFTSSWLWGVGQSDWVVISGIWPRFISMQTELPEAMTAWQLHNSPYNAYLLL